MSQTVLVQYTVKGMTCTGCEAKVERILTRLDGVASAKASFATNSVTVKYNPGVAGVLVMAQALQKAGYTLEEKKAPRRQDMQGRPGKADKKPLPATWPIGVGVLLLALYFILDNTVGFQFIPEVDASMGYGMLFVVGLLTSIHCVAMCGGINLSQCLSPSGAAGAGKAGGAVQTVWPSVLYNGGRVISYTVVGGVVGAVGSVISLSGWARGAVAVLAGFFMVVMALSMMGVFPWINRLVPRMPRFLQARANEARRGKGPFVVGLLNGLMPCGPLQAMQLYALGTGSFAAGALSMLVFSLGTVPLMFALGALSTVLSGKFSARMMKVSAALVLALGVVMVSRGLSLSGVTLPAGGESPRAAVSASASPGPVLAGGVQEITSKLTGGRYPQITVQAGTPVRWHLQADAKDLNGCNRSLVIPAYNLQVDLKAGDNVIEFTPSEEGTIPYSCWMGMINGRINVVGN